MQKFNHRGVPADLSAKMEAARESLNPRLRGEKLDAFIEQWNKDNLTPQQMVSLGSWVASRFKAGATAIPMKFLDKIAAAQDKPFANADAFKAWLESEGFPPELKKKIYDEVPNTVKVAKDTVLCLDFNTGKELWRWASLARPPDVARPAPALSLMERCMPCSALSSCA